MLRLALVSIVLALSTTVDAQDSYTEVVRSGPQQSGAKADWSPWYVVDAPVARPGYIISAVDFKVQGDRSCGSFAECIQVERDAYVTSWKFKTQGHSQVGPFETGIRTSEGILTVTYVKGALPNRQTFTLRRESHGMWSGTGTAFGCIPDHLKGALVQSPPCTLAAYPPPAGYVIDGSSFVLEGNRQCGSWSHCTQTKNTPTEAEWQFDMQGHESRNPISTQGWKENSWGVLSIRYRKK